MWTLATDVEIVMKVGRFKQTQLQKENQDQVEEGEAGEKEKMIQQVEQGKTKKIQAYIYWRRLTWASTEDIPQLSDSRHRPILQQRTSGRNRSSFSWIGLSSSLFLITLKVSHQAYKSFSAPATPLHLIHLSLYHQTIPCTTGSNCTFTALT